MVEYCVDEVQSSLVGGVVVVGFVLVDVGFVVIVGVEVVQVVELVVVLFVVGEYLYVCILFMFGVLL